MPRSASRRTLLAVVAVAVVPFALAADPPPAQSQTVPPYEFSFLPKAFQAHPTLAISVITEMTDEGRARQSPTPAKPAYYLIVSAGFHQEGPVVGDEKGSAPVLEKRVENALATNGYLQSSKEHPATLLLNFFWGVHNKLEKGDVETGDGHFVDIRHRNLISRARLVGGAAFARDFAKALELQDRSGGAVASSFDPVYLFAIRDDLTHNLVEQALDDCYYVVVSAYDYAAFTRGERRLLWRTKMSTPAQGVSLVETTPALADSGASFFGRDMAGAAIVGKRIARDGSGHVELGPLQFKGYIEKPGEKESPPAK